ncbi:MAG TPA: hypothetical protein VFC12_05120 [Terriglobales bacterium]|nr:hypothetical protein [Terriglobales bacterium]
MAWERPSTGFDPQGSDPPGPDNSIVPIKHEIIELVGPHLRVSGDISLLKFSRLSDLINHSRGYVRLTNARLLRRNGEPTNLIVQELMVNQDEITFIGQTAEEISSAPTGYAGMDRPLMERVPRQLVIFTPGHTLTGTISLFVETDIVNFVDTPDPRFIAMVDVTARSLADRRVISHFGLALVNRTQIAAASLLEYAGGADETGVMVE